MTARHWQGALIFVCAVYLMLASIPMVLRAQSSINVDGGSVTIVEGRCTVRWYGGPPYGNWLYELHCTPEPTPTPTPSQSSVVGGVAGQVSPTLGPPVRHLITWFYCSYDSGYRGDGGGYCGTMASGKRVYAGAAACGYVWPLGTVLEIEGYGRVVCEDRGSAVNGRHIDIFMWTSSEGTACGCQYVQRTVREVLR